MLRTVRSQVNNVVEHMEEVYPLLADCRIR